MLDIRYVKNNSVQIKESIKKRNQKDKLSLVDEVTNKYNEWVKVKKQLDELRHSRNVVSEEINKLKKEKQDISQKLKEVKGIPWKIKELDDESQNLQKRIKEILGVLPNVLHPKVPIGKDAEDNKVLRKWGKPIKTKFELKTHTELLENLNVADFDAGRLVSGQGFNYLTNEIALLDLALQKYGVDFLLKKKFKLIIPPMLLNKESLSGVLNFGDFKDVIYKIENEDLYLIGTAEHSLVSFFRNKSLRKEDLPIKVCAVTPCFRKEIGGHGVDTKGLFRMHQFNKVEQVVVSKPEDSYKMLEEMQKITESFFKSLKIPFRVVEICSGDLGQKFSKQYDIEAWFPRQNSYQEVTSAGNCTDFQAMSLNIKYLDGNEKKYPHILNNTMVATSRAMVAIIENYQKKDGSIKIPNVLRKYMHGVKEIRRKN